jgi:hypothetical protein
MDFTEAALRRVSQSPYRFCPDPACAVVYFDQAGPIHESRYQSPGLSEGAVGDRIVCHCFAENETETRRELEQRGRSAAIVFVGTSRPAAACVRFKTRGAWCLGDVTEPWHRSHNRWGA